MSYYGSLEYAIRFATIAHGNQKRKYTGEPYVNHPLNVLRLAGSCESCTAIMEMAAVLHDVVEDTEATLVDIEDFFGSEVKGLVYWLTDVSKPEDGNREIRKAIDREHISKAPRDAKTIKLCDLIDNTASIVGNDIGFTKVYLKEKLSLLEVLKEGDEWAYFTAKSIATSLSEYVEIIDYK